MSIPQRRTHAEFESNAVKSNIKEQRLLEKNINILNVEETYAMRILDLDSRDINTYRNKMNERTAKIKSHLTTVDIIKMKELEAAGKMKGIGNKTVSPSAAILSAAEKRLNIKPRPKTSLPVRQYHSRKNSPNIEENRSDDTLSQEESQPRDYKYRSLVKQPSLSNLHQATANDSADQEYNTTWARPSPKPRKRPNSSFVSSSRYRNGDAVDKGTSIPSPVVKKIVIPTAENADDTVSDIEELPNDQVFIPCEEDNSPVEQEVSIEKPAPRQKYRKLPIPTKRQERENKGEVQTKTEKSKNQSRCPYKGTPMKVVPSATPVSMVCNDSTVGGGLHRTSRPGSGIPVKNGDVKYENRRPQTAKPVSSEDRAMEHFPRSHDSNETSHTSNRPKTAKVPPSLGYAEIHRNRRVRSPDHSMNTHHPKIHQNKPDNRDVVRSVSRKLPVRPERSPSTRIPIRPVTAHSRSVEIELEESRPVPQRRLSRPRTAKANVNPMYTGVESKQHVPEYSTPESTSSLPPPISPRECITSHVDSKSAASVSSPRQSQDPSLQSMTNIPRYIPIAPQQRASIVPRTPRVLTVSSSSKRINASVVDRLNDFSSVLPYASSGNSVTNQTNEIPAMLQSQHSSETRSSQITQRVPSQKMQVTKCDQDSFSSSNHNNKSIDQNHDSIVDFSGKQDSNATHYQQPNPQLSIPRPGSARPRRPAQASGRSLPEDETVSSATEFRNTLSRTYDTQEVVISAKPPRPLQRPTTARTQIPVGDQPVEARGIPRPRTARMLPTTPQRKPQLEKYPSQTETGPRTIVTKAIVHSPRPPSAPAESRIRVPDVTEYVTHDASVPVPSRIAVRTKTPKKPSLNFHFDSHKITTQKNSTEQQDTLPPKVYSTFEEAMADYLERAAADNIFSENVLNGFRKSLIKLEKLKFAKIEDKMTLFLNKMDEYLERSGKVIPDWFKPLRFRKTVEEPVVVTFDPATYFKNRRKCKYQHNKGAFERQNTKDTDPNVTWNGIKKCRYLRIPNEMIDHSGMRTLGTDQIQLMKTLKGID
ncbi:nascent polypeptide-associated complex subunit alpha, muscle-specific form-like [Ylistrum balloti]|uniref:nascent polypeptide-associated complex subunit alpha, muscle-specific form-like n=1 Tax=Ylistrum balloti TaxID=509963 RepID=UPI002905E685|nr:nascent polypeptide-associated complex subunit alpha, muscle-specific form-like [Ylistrum balloti]